MAMKIEKLLQIVSEMLILDEKKLSENHQVIQFVPDELSASDLDMVAAASKVPDIPTIPKKETL